ncbi:CxC2 domain-containing protein [Phanerochaete sordida]|uniref:CxC2 domain-containing protein n=1 Tax=Phanerochaete sordida TaxID=48140 RepID=A0A9P3LLQ7_9APHY|nr:CxC2 domain-containing protein [Phanerochaete sordida]
MSSRRKRKLEVTEEIFIPSASRGAQRPHTVLDDRVADNMRTIHRHTTTYFPPPPATAQPPEELHYASDPDGGLSFDFSAVPSNEEIERYLSAYGLDDEETTKKSEEDNQRTFATLEHDPTLREWTTQAEKFLDELLRLEGTRGASREICPLCPPSAPQAPLYRCSDCFGGQLVCQGCCLAVHHDQPFHRIKRWNGQYFEKITLQAIGLTVQLGHPHGQPCASPIPAPRASLVIHTNGMHPVTLLFCGCSNIAAAGDRTQQLLRAELYGASLTDPTTFCTFRVLEHFHVLTLQSKITAYDYYMTLQAMTDITGLGPQYERLKPFLRTIREWRYLKMLKRGGRGHVANGVQSMKPGELCLRCPACPRPGVNLPDNWDTVSDDLRYMYLLILAIDANFRLKRRAVSSDARDPGLLSGYGYFTPDDDYRAHILQYADQDDISTCTGFAAMAHANTKFSKGYATTGVGLVLCARHGFIQPTGVGDLQKGERQVNVYCEGYASSADRSSRYCTMDYIAMSALKCHGPHAGLMFSYDIACQWEINLRRRIAEDKFPAHLKLELPVGRDLRFVIPKYHFWGHTGEDHNKYSLNLVPGVGRTDGEEVERNWWRHDATAASTREMGPGSRHDTLEDHFHWSNFTKIVSLGRLLGKRLKTALLGYSVHSRLFAEFSSGVDTAYTTSWTAQVLAYEQDLTLPDPYHVESTGLTEREIKTRLAAQEDKEASEGRPSLHQVTPLNMLVELLEIEELKRRFHQKYPVITREILSLSPDIFERRAVIRRRTQTVREIQAIYMPLVAQLVAAELPSIAATLKRKADARRKRAGTSTESTETPVDDHPSASVPPEHIPLFLPSDFPSDHARSLTPRLREMESELREGQMRNALDKLRVHLHIKTRLASFKARQVRHQKENMKAREQLETNDMKIKSFKEKYRAARAAKLCLDGPGRWEEEWRPLADNDVRGLRDFDPLLTAENEELPRRQVVTEGGRRISWIWIGVGRQDESGEAGTLGGMNEALRGEWLRARARPLRYREEIVLVNEEQRRTVVTLEVDAAEWDRRAGLREIDCPVLAEGVAAYAAEQAGLLRGLAGNFQSRWHAVKAIENPVTADEGQEAEVDGGTVLYSFAKDDSDDEGAMGGGDMSEYE